EQYGPNMRSLPSNFKILTSGKSTEENQTENVTEPDEIESPPPAPQKKKRKRKKIGLEPVIEKELPKKPVKQTATKQKL
ncbi:VrrA protein, partial [Bacillus cereus]|uniref:VrrA/YqfQ family protein n=1 Tax=Bacillus cereus TaxID=1396 RepID=UPI00284E5DE2